MANSASAKRGRRKRAKTHGEHVRDGMEMPPNSLGELSPAIVPPQHTTSNVENTFLILNETVGEHMRLKERTMGVLEQLETRSLRER